MGRPSRQRSRANRQEDLFRPSQVEITFPRRGKGREAYLELVREIVRGLKEGAPPWRQPWFSAAPRNLKTRQRYSAMNSTALLLSANRHGFTSEYWVTAKQAQSLGGRIANDAINLGTTIWGGGWGWHTWTDKNGSPITVWRLYLRPATLYNVDQAIGLEARVPRREARKHTPNERCEAIRSMFKDGPGVVLSPDEACYQPLLDLVSMPAPEQFASPSAYYATLFHELIHATGHDSRLARFSTTSVTFGEVSRLDYAHEELVADLGGAFLCLEASIANETVKGHTSYLGSWIAVLEKKPEVLHQVLSAAERAAGWIMGHQDPRRVAETDGPRTTMDLGSFERAADVRFA